jgi:hypothetical protein
MLDHEKSPFSCILRHRKTRVLHQSCKGNLCCFNRYHFFPGSEGLLSQLLYGFLLFIQAHGSEPVHFGVNHPCHHLVPVLGIFCEDFIFKFVVGVWPGGRDLRSIFQDQPLWVVLAESSGSESELQLAQPFLFGLSGVLHQVEAYMESIRYKHLLFILE